MTSTAKDTARPFGIVIGIIVILIAVFGTLAGLHNTTGSTSATPAKVQHSNTPAAPSSSPQVQPTHPEEKEPDVPSAGPKPDTPAAPDTATHRDNRSVYVVRHGDTLWDIARAHYGDPLKWHEIARDNHLTHPQLIYPGDRIEL